MHQEPEYFVSCLCLTQTFQLLEIITCILFSYQYVVNGIKIAQTEIDMGKGIPHLEAMKSIRQTISEAAQSS